LELSEDIFSFAYLSCLFDNIEKLGLDEQDIMVTFKQANLCFAMQMALIAIIMKEQVLSIFGDEQFVPSTDLNLSRFLCAYILHYILSPEFDQAVRMIKYVTNHPGEFKYENEAWFVAFL
jgi:hypothetical protein